LKRRSQQEGDDLTPQTKPKFKRILVPLDGSKLGEAAVPYVEELASIAGAEIILLQIVRLQYDLALVDAHASDLNEISSEYVTHASVAAREYLDSVKERLTKKGISVQTLVEVGSPAEKVVACAREKNVDLIALSTHGHPGIGQRALGSVTYKVLHYADRPVFLVTPSARATSRSDA
jgi:nucleotide-binding universal stress UspA family protein